MGKSLIVTGSWLINFRLSRLPEKLQKKHIKKACRESAKKEAMPRIQESIRSEAYDTGAMHDAVKVRATSRTIKAKTDKVKTFTKRDGTEGTFNVKVTVGQEFGAKVEITRKDLNKQLVKRGQEEIGDSDYFYPAGVELGTSDEPAQKPIRKVLKTAHRPVQKVFERELAALIRNPK